MDESYWMHCRWLQRWYNLTCWIIMLRHTFIKWRDQNPTSMILVFSAVLVNVCLELFHTDVFIRWVFTKAPPHFNGIAHFLAQCGSEPWSTTITARAPTCTPLWVPQRVIKVRQCILTHSTTASFTKVIPAHEWRCSWTRVLDTGAVAIGESHSFWRSCSKGPYMCTYVWSITVNY